MLAALIKTLESYTNYVFWRWLLVLLQDSKAKILLFSPTIQIILDDLKRVMNNYLFISSFVCLFVSPGPLQGPVHRPIPPVAASKTSHNFWGWSTSPGVWVLSCMVVMEEPSRGTTETSTSCRSSKSSTPSPTRRRSRPYQGNPNLHFFSLQLAPMLI